MQLIEDQSEQLIGVLPKSYTDFSDELLSEHLRIFNNSALDEVDGDIIGRIYEYFLNKFAKNLSFTQSGYAFDLLQKLVGNRIKGQLESIDDCVLGLVNRIVVVDIWND